MSHRKGQINLQSIQRNIQDECNEKIKFYSKKITTLKKISSQSFTKIKQPHTLQGIQNGREVQLLYKRYKKTSQTLVKTIFLMVILNFFYFQQQTKLITSSINDKSNQVSLQDKEFAKWNSSKLIIFNFVLSIFSCKCYKIIGIFSVIRYESQKLLYSTQKISYLKRFYLVVQIIVIMLQPLPGLDSAYIELSIKQNNYQTVLIKINHIMCIFALFKLVFLFRYALEQNCAEFFQVNSRKFFRPSYNRICKIYSCEKDYIHIMKCLFKQHFILFIILVYSLLLLLGAYVLRIAEINYDGRFFYFDNSFWLTLMSMTTIGYGDITPSTSLGILIDGFSAYSGVIIVSLLVASLTDLFTMNYRQRRTLLILKRLKMKEKLKQAATSFIKQTLYRLYKQKQLGKKLKPTLKQKQSEIEFHQKRMDLKNNKEGSLNLVKQMYDQFQAVRLRIEELIEIENELMTKLSDQQRFAIQTVRSNKILRRNSLDEQKRIEQLNSKNKIQQKQQTKKQSAKLKQISQQNTKLQEEQFLI